MKRREAPAEARRTSRNPIRPSRQQRQAQATERKFRTVYLSIVSISIVLIVVFGFLVRGKIGHMLGQDDPGNGTDFEVFPYHSLPSSEGTGYETEPTESTAEPWTDTWVPTDVPPVPVVTTPPSTSPSETSTSTTETTTTDENAPTEPTSDEDTTAPTDTEPTTAGGEQETTTTTASPTTTEPPPAEADDADKADD